MHLPRCPVEGKLCFPSEKDAAAELFECRIKFLFQNQRRRKETRSYLCDHCGAFHLTAMAVPPSHVGAAHRNGVHMAPNKNRRRQSPLTRTRPSGGGNGGGSDLTSGFTSDWSGGDTSSDSGYSSSSSSDSGC